MKEEDASVVRGTIIMELKGKPGFGQLIILVLSRRWFSDLRWSQMENVLFVMTRYESDLQNWVRIQGQFCLLLVLFCLYMFGFLFIFLSLIKYTLVDSGNSIHVIYFTLFRKNSIHKSYRENISNYISSEQLECKQLFLSLVFPQ